MAAHFPTDPGSPTRDGPIALAIAAVVIATVALGALAPARGPVERRAVSPADDPACAEWSDGCRVCRRLAAGPICSTPGIACTPGEPECLRPADAP